MDKSPQKVKESTTKPPLFEVTSIFISYHHSDRVVAASLRNELLSLAEKGAGKPSLEVFLDIESINPGEPWASTIFNGLAKADWLVVLYTGVDSEFCGYEVGTFDQMHAKRKNKGFYVPATSCVYDVAPERVPGFLELYQNTPVQPISFIEQGDVRLDTTEIVSWYESPLGKLIVRICEIKGLYLPSHEPDKFSQNIALAAKKITYAFAIARGTDLQSITQSQLSFEMTIEQVGSKWIDAIPEGAVIVGNSKSFNIFDINMPFDKNSAPTTTWGWLSKVLLADRIDVPWMRKVELDVLRSIKQKNVSSEDVSFIGADGRLYRPTLVEHKIYFNGTHKFQILFIETPNRKFIGDRTSSLILTGLILGSRLWFTYFERLEETKKLIFGDDIEIGVFGDNCRQLIYNLDWIEYESIEYGTADPAALIDAFGGENKARTERFFQEWSGSKATLLKSLSDAGPLITADNRVQIRDAVLRFLKSTQTQNSDFILLCIDVYRNELIKKISSRKSTQN